MAKNSSQRFVTPRIIQADSRPSLWLWILALVAIGLWTWQVYDYGLRHAADPVVSESDEEEALRTRIAELEQERDELRFLAAKHERSSQIDREAAQAIRGEIESLEDERAELQLEAEKLRSLVSEGGDRLEVTEYSLRKTGERRYRYQFKVTRDIEGAKKLEGWVTLRVAGLSSGESEELSLPELTGGSLDIHRLGFKHYQTIDGDLQLPAGFEPDRLTIEVTPIGTQFKAFTISYDWATSDA